MAYIDHRCRRCGHLWISHTMYGCSYRWCKKRCSRVEADFDQPEVIPTYKAWNDPNHDITPPGEPVFYTDPEGPGIVLACRCDQCLALFRQLVREVPA